MDVETLAPITAPEDLAAEAGFRIPVLISPTVWGDCVEWDSRDSAETGLYQEQDARLWNLLWPAGQAINGNTGESVPFVVHRWSGTEPYPIADEDPEPPMVVLVARREVNDAGDPVITISDRD